MLWEPHINGNKKKKLILQSILQSLTQCMHAIITAMCVKQANERMLLPFRDVHFIACTTCCIFITGISLFNTHSSILLTSLRLSFFSLLFFSVQQPHSFSLSLFYARRSHEIFPFFNHLDNFCMCHCNHWPSRKNNWECEYKFRGLSLVYCS